MLPVGLMHNVLRMAHIGHPGMVKMKCRLRETYWWPGLDSQVEQLVKCCEGCQMSSKSQPPDPILKWAIPKPDKPWSRVAIDISGPFHTVPQKEQFVVSVVDYFSGFLEVLLATDIRSVTIVNWLRMLVARYGYPDEMVRDNGPQFTSQEFQLFLEGGGVKDLPAAVFNPRENGLVK